MIKTKVASLVLAATIGAGAGAGILGMVQANTNNAVQSIEQSTGKMQTAITDANNAVTKINILQEAVTKEKSEVERLTLENAGKEELIENLGRQITEYVRRLATATGDKDNLKNQIEELKSKATELQNTINENEEKIANHEKEMQDKEGELKNAKDALKAEQDKNSDSEGEMIKIDTAVKDQQKQINDAVEANDDTTGRLTTALTNLENASKIETASK